VLPPYCTFQRQREFNTFGEALMWVLMQGFEMHGLFGDREASKVRRTVQVILHEFRWSIRLRGNGSRRAGIESNDRGGSPPPIPWRKRPGRRGAKWRGIAPGRDVSIL
jgi:hypothetical protein